MNPKEFIASGTLEAYALGTATPREVSLSEEMIRQYPEVEAEYQAIAEAIEQQVTAFAKPAPAAAWAAIASQLQPETNTSGQASTLSQAVQAEGKTISINAKSASYTAAPSPSARGGKQVFMWQWASVAMAAMLILSLGINFYFYRSNTDLSEKLASAEQQNEVIAQTASLTKEQLAKADYENGHLEGLLQQALKPTSGIIQMKPMVDLIAKGKMAVTYDKTTKMVALRGSNMPNMPEGKVVQLWAIVDGKPVSLGLATKAAEGNMVMAEMPAGMAEPQAFALSLEDGTAKASPEGPVIAMGQVSL